MFLGGHANTMDAKGRVHIPAAFEILDAQAWRKETELADSDTLDATMLEALGL